MNSIYLQVLTPCKILFPLIHTQTHSQLRGFIKPYTSNTTSTSTITTTNHNHASTSPSTTTTNHSPWHLSCPRRGKPFIR